MTETITAPYSPKVFESLEDLLPATAKFKDLKGPEWLDEVGKGLLEKHAMTRTFGYQLLHRHFDLNDDEMLVEVNNVSTPWPKEAASDSPRSKISGRSWKLVAKENSDSKKSAFMPYEFAYNSVCTKDDNTTDLTAPINLNDGNHKAFLDEFPASICNAGLDHIIALTAIPEIDHRGGLEITQGRANILLLPGQFYSADAENGVEATWYFPAGVPVNYWCSIKCLPGSGPSGHSGTSDHQPGGD
ncbi:hypothetical protein H2200_002975 [Cladophialophora chaetospira]|uniref:Uncharacterized protein n=1 Tax=Cladophialophora chaetospira TaxID=386627 RepID=A0AA38XGJ7_9EURO|nr:hypothetical protein H2200_002975 [Cladophialophora chaetospira]